MGTRFRKSINFGPLRVNISKSGVGYSVGNKYARITHTADGKKRTTLNIPGTGVSYVEESARNVCTEDEENRKTASSVGAWIKFLVYMAIILALFYALSGRVGASSINSTVASEVHGPVETEDKDEGQEESVVVVHIVNKKTMKYHEYGCKSAPKASSKSYWLAEKTDEELEELGYTHCKNCLRRKERTMQKSDIVDEPETLDHAPEYYNDGFICFADKTTKIYHNSWCEYAPEFKSSNCYTDFTTAEKIESEGFKPCAKCIW